MSNETKIVPSAQETPLPGGQFTQNGDDNTLIANYGGNVNVDVKIQSNQQFGGNIYVPSQVDMEYYNLFVVCGEEFDKPYFKMLRARSLNEFMDKETKSLFDTLSPEALERIKTMPSLFLDENSQYGQADDTQYVRYGFVSDIKIYETNLKVFYTAYCIDIPQQLLNGLLEELALVGNSSFNELNRTHWSIKRRNLIQELTEAGIQIPIFNYQ